MCTAFSDALTERASGKRAEDHRNETSVSDEGKLRDMHDSTSDSLSRAPCLHRKPRPLGGVSGSRPRGSRADAK